VGEFPQLSRCLYLFLRAKVTRSFMRQSLTNETQFYLRWKVDPVRALSAMGRCPSGPEVESL